MTNRSNQTIGGNTATDVGLKQLYARHISLHGLGHGRHSPRRLFLCALRRIYRNFPQSICSFRLCDCDPASYSAPVGSKLPTMSLGGVLAFLFGFAAFMGIFVSAITLIYPTVVLAKVFFMTVAMFGALSFFGHTTERDLSTFVKYAAAAFLAYVGIHLLGAFVPGLRPTGPLDTIISIVALGAIAVITAWETQMLKRVYYGVAGNPAMEGKMAAYGAASLLLAFVTCSKSCSACLAANKFTNILKKTRSL